MTFAEQLDQIAQQKHKETLDTILETTREDRISSMCPSTFKNSITDKLDNFNTPDFLITGREDFQDQILETNEEIQRMFQKNDRNTMMSLPS